MNYSGRKIFFPLIPLFVLIAGLQVASTRGWIPPFLFPAPSQVANALTENAELFTKAFFQTLKAAAAGLTLSMILGLGCALTLSFSRLAREMFYPYAVFFQTVPIIAIAPLLVIWLGYGMSTVIASSFIVSIFPIIANSVFGLLSTDPKLLDLFELMDAKPAQVLFQLRLPSALPAILNGFKIAAGLAVIGAIVGEFISGSGLGGLVDAARNQQRVDEVFGAVLLAALLGVLFFAVISFISRIIIRYFHLEAS